MTKTTSIERMSIPTSFWFWDERTFSGNVKVEGKTIMKIGNSGWNSSVLGTLANPSSFKVKYEGKGDCSTMIGLAPAANFKIDATNHKTNGWYLYCNYGTLYSHMGDNGRAYLNKKIPSGEIEVILNEENKTISFVIAGMKRGIAFSKVDLSQPLYPAFCFCTAGDKITIIS